MGNSRRHQEYELKLFFQNSQLKNVISISSNYAYVNRVVTWQVEDAIISVLGGVILAI